MEASNRKKTVADKERIFEELQDLVSDQLKVRWRLFVRTELIHHLHIPLCVDIPQSIVQSPMIALSYWWWPVAFKTY